MSHRTEPVAAVAPHANASPARVLTVTCNAAVDTTYLIGSVRLGAINRVERVLPAPGGKGNNVARILAALGHSPIATGFSGGHSGRLIEDGLTAAGVRPLFVRVSGESRTCLTIVERDSNRITEIREPGVPVAAPDGDALLNQIGRLAAEIDIAVISGSLPPGLPDDYYAQQVAVLKGAGVFVALDTSGEALRLGATAGPDLIKPNLDELVDLIGAVPSAANLPELARQRALGPILSEEATVLLSLGAEGAASIRRDRIVQASPPAEDVVNTVGAGDALLAGYLDARARGLAEDAVLAHAVAVGTASARHERVGEVDPREIASIRPRVRVTSSNPSTVAPTATAFAIAGQPQGR